MLKHALVAAAVLCAALPAVAQTRPENTTKVTVEQADRILNALAALDGYQKVVKDGGQDKVVLVAYELSGNTRKLIAKDIDILTPVLRQYGKVRQGLVKQFFNRDVLPASGSEEFQKMAQTDTFKKLTDEVQKQLDAPVDEEVQKISDADLKLDTNPIPPSVLAALSPIRIQ